MFSSYVYDFVLSLISQDTRRLKFVLFSDGCSSQNRNAIMANALLHIAVKHGACVEQRYREKGHTQMECDSIHSVIAKGYRNKEIYSPQNYVDIMNSLPLKKPYVVKQVDYTFFKDFSDVKYYNSNRSGNYVGDPVVTDIRALNFYSAFLLNIN